MKIFKLFTIFLIILFLSVNIFAQKSKPAEPKFDPVLAKKFGADEYGMKQYVMVLLKHGNLTVSKEERETMFSGHMKNMQKLAEQGKLILAGPFTEDKDLAGIFIFDVKTIDEAQKLLETDPAVKAKLLVSELHFWYGSAALMQIAKLHKTVQKKSFID